MAAAGFLKIIGRSAGAAAPSKSLREVLSPILAVGERERHDISSRRDVPVARIVHVSPSRSEQRPGSSEIAFDHSLNRRRQAAPSTFHPSAFPNLRHDCGPLLRSSQ